MKKILLLIFCLLIGYGVSSAQKKCTKNREEMRKEIMDFKLKFIAQEIDLKDSQKKQFSDLYSKMEEEKHQMFEAARKADRKVKHAKNATDKDYEAASKAFEECKAKEAQIDKKYEPQFSKFLSAKQIYQMRQAEDKFRQKMREMRKNKRK